MSEGEGASNKIFGSGGNRWHGQIVDDSVWRDNILAGKYEDKDTPPGWGRRYKVRVFGEHDLGGEEGYPIPDEQLPWANIEFPVTAGSGAGNCKQTPNLRQGNIVSGYWADGDGKQMPIITGVFANNEQNEMGTTYPVPVTESGTSLAVSAFANKQLKLPEGTARPKPPQTSLITKKPTSKAIAQEIANVIPDTPLDDLGLPFGRPRTPTILADIQKAAELAGARGDLNPSQITEFTKYYVQRGISERKKQARSPFSPASPGATTEALGEHLKTAQDIGRENKCEEKIILISPDDVVGSATKAIQTISENLTQQIKLYTNSLTDYAAATQRPGDDFPKMVKDSATQISKYMKVIMQKVQEYTNKKMNAELTDVVAEMPSYMRAQFLDVKEENNKNLSKSFNGITDGMGALLEDILTSSLDINGLVEQAQEMAASSDPFSLGLGLIGDIIDAAESSTGNFGTGVGTGTGGTGGTTGTTTGTTGNATTTFSPGSNDSTIDLSDVAQPYNTGQTYQPGEVILFENKIYICAIRSKGVEPSVFNSNWRSHSGIKGILSPENEIIPYQNEERKTYTKVPICYAEDIVGKVFSYNKASINGAVEKAVNGMNKYVEDMQSQLNEYEGNFTYKAGKGSTKEVIALSDEEGLNDDRGGAGYTTQVSVPTTFRGSVGNAGNQATGGGLKVDITVSRGGPVGRAPSIKDSTFNDLTAMSLTANHAEIDKEYYWITQKDQGNGNYKVTLDDGSSSPGPFTQDFDTGILYNCSTTLSAYIDENNVTQPARTTSPLGIGASVDIYFEGGDVKAIRCKNPYNGSVSANGYKIGDVLTINGAGASGGTADGGSFVNFAGGGGTGATFMINRYEGLGNAKINNVKGRLRGPIDDRGIQIANGGKNYQVGQLVNIAQLGNPLPVPPDPADNIGSPQGGTPGGSGGVDASFTVTGVFDKGDIGVGVEGGAITDDTSESGDGGFSNMLSSLSGVLGSLTSALDFDNMPSNIFPFELPPNKALADFYTLGDAGQAAPDSEIPMIGQITKMASKPPYVPGNIEELPFALPVNPQNLNLKIRATAKDALVALDNTVAGWKNASSRLMDT